jgi:PKD repeat protein
MKTIKLIYLVLFVALLAGCKKDDTAPTGTNPTPPTGSSPVANFTFTPASGVAPLQVQFTNISNNATSYAWDFGNGQTSAVANASTTYTTAGTYTIKLTATGADGKTSVKTASITVTAPPTPVVQTYEFKDKWISAGGPEPKSYRNHHYTFEVKEEMDFKVSLTSSVNIALYLYNELDILGGQTNGYSSSASLTGKLKAGKYRLIAAGVKDSEVPYVLTFTGKFAAKPEKVISQYQQIIGKWTYSNGREAYSASNRHYDIEVTQDSQLDVILNSSVPTKISIINELGFKTDVSFGQNSTLADITLKKGKYRIVAYTTGSGLEANFVLNIFGLFANVIEIKSIEQQLTGSWTNSSTLATSPNNPKYNIEITQDSMLDIVLFGAATNLNSRFYVLNDKGDIVGNFPGYGQQLLREVINLKKGIYTIVPATSSNGWTSNFTLTVFGHHISNFRLK